MSPITSDASFVPKKPADNIDGTCTFKPRTSSVFTYAEATIYKRTDKIALASLFAQDSFTELYAASCAIGPSRPRACLATTGDVFFQSAILVLHPVKKFVMPFKDDPTIAVSLYEDSKHVIMQTAIAGCSAAVAAMLSMDKGKIFPLKVLQSRSAETSEQIEKDLLSLGFTAKKTDLKDLKTGSCLDIRKLDDLIFRYGPAIVRILEAYSDIAHFIIVDAISFKENTVTVRDPWHGYLMDIDLDVFVIQWKRPFRMLGKICDFVIQIEQ